MIMLRSFSSSAADDDNDNVSTFSSSAADDDNVTQFFVSCC